MKRLLATLMLIFALSISAFGGHHQVGGLWCDCTDPAHGSWGMTVEDEAIQQDEAPNNEVSELEIMIDVLLMLIRF